MLSAVERLSGGRLDDLRRSLWRRRAYRLRDTRETFWSSAPCAASRRRFGRSAAAAGSSGRTARAGGGFYPDRNEIELAAGVETYEGLRSGRALRVPRALPLRLLEPSRCIAATRTATSRTCAARSATAERSCRPSRATADWVTGSFLRQGDHANPVEYFADIPTNFRDTAELPPLIRAHFAPLIDGSTPTFDFTREPDWPMDDEFFSLATFQRWLAGKTEPLLDSSGSVTRT